MRSTGRCKHKAGLQTEEDDPLTVGSVTRARRRPR
jgi:hypothetical protein